MTSNQRKSIVAVDLGADNCRVSLLRFQNHQQVFQIVHRCANGPFKQKEGWFGILNISSPRFLRGCANALS